MAASCTPNQRTRVGAALLQATAALLVAAGLTACGAGKAHLAGRVVHRQEGLAEAAVMLEPIAGGEALTTRTGADGSYRFPPLPAGSYRLLAESAGPPPLGARSGKNPVQLAPGQRQWIGLQAVPWSRPRFQPAPEAPDGFGNLSGVLHYDDAPLAGAAVDLYLSPDELRGPGFRQSLPTGADGVYSLEEVTAGRYYLVARKRASGTVTGPVVEGDLYGEALANPVTVRSQEETLLDVHLVRKERDDDPNADRLAAPGAALRGQVVDGSGNPVAGVYVFAYRNRIIGHRMPDYRTLATGPDGAFSLSLGDGGLFYVGAREHSGGSPLPGEWFGFYEGSADHGVTVTNERTVDGIRIVVRRVLEP